jgi:diaminopimelate epimerase
LKISFHKYSATGNDFILIDNRNNILDAVNVDLFKKMAKRRLGIGADGVLLVEKSLQHDFRMRYINADGGEVEMCANGARAISFYAHHILKINKENLYQFETMNGLYISNVFESYVKLKMTELYDINKLNISGLFDSDSNLYLNTGVPHCVFETKNLDNLDIVKIARPIRNNILFQNGTNVNFYKYLSGNQIQVRTYERGVEDETLSCGTGVVAAAFHANKTHLLNDKVSVLTKGGNLTVEFMNQEIFLEGAVDEIYSGNFNT